MTESAANFLVIGALMGTAKALNEEVLVECEAIAGFALANEKSGRVETNIANTMRRVDSLADRLCTISEALRLMVEEARGE